MKSPHKPAQKPSSSTRLARPLLPREGLSGDKKLTEELQHLRGELRNREADAKALADRIAALQQRIDTAMSTLGRPQEAKRREKPHKSASKK